MTQFAKKIRLTNGTSVIFERNDNAKIVSIQLGVKVGAVYESDDESGICHLIEHMVFKGTKSYQAGEIATLVEAHGGELNAYTSLDQTVYYINLPSKHFLLGLKLIKEMAFDAQMDETELTREKEVVVEEIRRGQDSPQRVLGELLFKTFYKTHNYRRPVIGTDVLVRGFSRDKVYNFYKKYYCPQNMILGVCGDITEAELSHGLEEFFRFEISSPQYSSDLKKEAPKSGHSVVMKAMDINATYFDLAFEVPAISHSDVPALDVLSHLFGESDTSLLEQNTKEKQQLVHSIYSSSYTPKFPGLFVIGGLVDPKLINKALFSIKEQIATVHTHLFEEEKIERAKLLARSQLIYEQQTCEGTAKKWITYETTAGNFKFDEQYLEAVNRLTPQDIQQVAKKYLDITKSILVILHPNKIKISIDKNLYKTTSTKKVIRFKKTAALNDAAVYKLDNGIRVVLKENHRLPLVSIRSASLGGLRYETSANNGISQLLSSVMARSTKHLPQETLAEKIEWLAGDLGGYTGRNSLGLSFTFLSEKIGHALPLLTDVMLSPAFDANETEKEKKLLLEAIKNQEDNPSQIVFKTVLEKLFENHPYRHQILGQASSVKKLNSQTIKKFYESIVVPKNLVISAVGDFDTAHLLDTLNNQLGALKNRNFTPKKIPVQKAPKGITNLFKPKNKQQAHVAIGFLGLSIYNKDKYVLEIINNILSGQGGRLFLELRDKQSLAYTVTSTLIEGLETGFFGTYIGTEPAKVNKAVSEMFKELKRLHTELVSREELDRAKNYIIGNHEIDHQKNGAIAMQLVLNELYGKELEEFFDFQKNVTKVTREDIMRVAQKYITLDHYVMGVVGPKGCWTK